MFQPTYRSAPIIPVKNINAAVSAVPSLRTLPFGTFSRTWKIRYLPSDSKYSTSFYSDSYSAVFVIYQIGICFYWVQDIVIMYLVHLWWGKYTQPNLNYNVIRQEPWKNSISVTLVFKNRPVNVVIEFDMPFLIVLPALIAYELEFSHH